MKKHFLSFATAGLFLGTLMFSFSPKNDGSVSLLSEAKAQNFGQQPFNALCPDKVKVIVLCGVGNGFCAPMGVCGR